MVLSSDPDWQPWPLVNFHPLNCGGHTYGSGSGQIVDMRRLCEKSFRSTGKFQVLHHHDRGNACNDQCEAYGREVPQLAG